MARIPNPFAPAPHPDPDPFHGPMQAAFRASQELYRSNLIAAINGRRMWSGRAPVAWPTVGGSAMDLIRQDGSARLYRYRATAPRAPATSGALPLLLVCSLINRPYVMDLLPERSVVRRFLDAGFDVWLLDWADPLPSDAGFGLDEYALGRLPRAAAAVCAVSGAPRLHVLGYCMGGTFALMAIAAGLLPAASLISLATPVALHDRGLLSAWCRTPNLDAREIARTAGNLQPYITQPAFKMLDPMGLVSKFRHLETKLADDEFLRFFLAMETWLEDSVAFPGGAFADWVDIYRGDSLARGTLAPGGVPVHLSRVTCPIFNVYAEGDYITPPESSKALAALVGGRCQDLQMPGGHIGLSTGGVAHKTLWPRAAEWLRAQESPPSTRPVNVDVDVDVDGDGDGDGDVADRSPPSKPSPRTRTEGPRASTTKTRASTTKTRASTTKTRASTTKTRASTKPKPTPASAPRSPRSRAR